MQRALFAGLAISIVVACSGPAALPSALHSTAGAQPRDTAALARQQAEFEPFAPAFQSLEAALAAHDDALGQRILTRILAREPQGVALERARAFERILEGRAWVAGLAIRLEAERLAGGDEWSLRAVAKNSNDTEVVLRGAPPTLRMLLLGVNPEGLEQRVSRQKSVDALAKWRLPAGVETSVPLGRFEIPQGTSLAVRALFVLEFLPGEIVSDGAIRPAANVPAARAEAVRLATFLPDEPVQPEELVRYVTEELVRTPPLLERTVRIPLEQRGRALDLLTPAVLELPSGELEKLAVALRWLSGENQLGADARSWRRWLDERARRQREQRESQAPRTGLDLPEAPPYRQ